MTIRNATEADLPAIVAIYNESIPGGKATADLEQFNLEREKTKESKQEKNRTLEAAMQEQMEADLESANPFERVVKLVDIEAKQDKSSSIRLTQPTLSTKAVPCRGHSTQHSSSGKLAQLMPSIRAASCRTHTWATKLTWVYKALTCHRLDRSQVLTSEAS